MTKKNMRCWYLIGFDGYDHFIARSGLTKAEAFGPDVDERLFPCPEDDLFLCFGIEIELAA